MMRFCNYVPPYFIPGIVLTLFSLIPALASTNNPLTELIELRTKTSKTWLNADGTRTVEISTMPIHYRTYEGTWQDIDINHTSAIEDGLSHSAFKNRSEINPTKDITAPYEGTGKDSYYDIWLRTGTGTRYDTTAQLSFGKNTSTQRDYSTCIKWDTTCIPANAVISHAYQNTTRIELNSYNATDIAYLVGIKEITEWPWPPTTLPARGETLETISWSSPNGYKYFSNTAVRELIQRWIWDPDNNYGVEVDEIDGLSVILRCWASEAKPSPQTPSEYSGPSVYAPRLIVTYDLDTQPPTVDLLSSPDYESRESIRVYYQTSDTDGGGMSAVSGVKQVTLYYRKRGDDWVKGETKLQEDGYFEFTGMNDDNIYYFGIVVEDYAGNKSDFDPTTGVDITVYDTTPPAIQVTDDGTRTAVSTQLHFSWNVVDRVSGISDCQYAVGTSTTDPGSNYMVPWRSISSVGEATETISLSPNTTYYVYIKATNGAGLLTTGASDGITVTSTAHVVDMISDNKDTNGEIKQYEKYEAVFSINPEWIGTAFIDYNPFSPKLTAYDNNSPYTWKKLNGIYVDAVITKPDETRIRWPCFYDYDRDEDGIPEWRFRFAPTAEGVWSYHIEVQFGTDIHEIVTGPIRSFVCTANNNPITGRGFLRKDKNDPWFFSFSQSDFNSTADDTVFYPFGVKCDDTTDIEALSRQELVQGSGVYYPGGTYSRLFRASRMLEQNYFDNNFVNDYQKSDVDWWDDFIETARENGVYLIYLLNDWTRWKSADTTVKIACAADESKIYLNSGAGFTDPNYTCFDPVFIDGTDTTPLWYVNYNTDEIGAYLLLKEGVTHPAYAVGTPVLQTWNPYIIQKLAIDETDCYNSKNTIMREVYKRKLRWLLARWGYSTSIMGFDLVNESQEGSGEDFHNDMASFVNGDDIAVPGCWPVQENDNEEQPHHLSGDHTSCEYRTVDVRWEDEPIGMCHFHDFACTSVIWSSLRTDMDTPDPWEQMGSSQERPWFDTAVWADRMARKQRQLVNWEAGYEKPFSWSEFGLAGNEHTGDWDDAYFGRPDDPATPNNEYLPGDTEGRHVRDWLWAAIFNKISVCHWLPRYFWGDCSSIRPGYQIQQWRVFLPLRNFLDERRHPVDMRGLTQESYYPVFDSLHNPKTLISSDPDVAVYGVHGATKAYLYVKNLTNTWYRTSGLTNPTPPPAPTQQAGVTITVKGMNAGTYLIEKWSTIDPDPSTQKVSIQEVTITQGQDLTFITTVEAAGDYAWAYKIYQKP